MKKHFIILVLILIPVIACIDTEDTIYEEIDTSNDRAVIQSDKPCDDCTLESQ